KRKSPFFDLNFAIPFMLPLPLVLNHLTSSGSNLFTILIGISFLFFCVSEQQKNKKPIIGTNNKLYFIILKLITLTTCLYKQFLRLFTGVNYCCCLSVGTDTSGFQRELYGSMCQPSLLFNP